MSDELEKVVFDGNAGKFLSTYIGCANQGELPGFKFWVNQEDVVSKRQPQHGVAEELKSLIRRRRIGVRRVRQSLFQKTFVSEAVVEDPLDGGDRGSRIGRGRASGDVVVADWRCMAVWITVGDFNDIGTELVHRRIQFGSRKWVCKK